MIIYKKLDGRTLWDFSTSILLQRALGCRVCRFVPWANGYNFASSQNFVELLVELFWSLQVVLKKLKNKKH